MGHCSEKRSDRPYRHSDKRKAERQWRDDAEAEHVDWNLCPGCSICDATYAYDDMVADLDFVNAYDTQRLWGP